MFLVKKNNDQNVNEGEYYSSVESHIPLGENYFEVMNTRTKNELFEGNELPKGCFILPVGTELYQNDSCPENHELSKLYIGVYSGHFNLNWKNKSGEFKDFFEVYQDLRTNPSKFTFTLKNAVNHFVHSGFLSETKKLKLNSIDKIVDNQIVKIKENQYF